MAKPNQPPQTPAATRPRPRILIADDCDGTREVVARILGDEYESVVLDNGASAWEQIEADPSIAALISDIDMPGLNGFELTQRVRESTEVRVRALPVIAITGAVDNETRRRAFVCGVTGMITKPIDRAQLLALVHAYIRPQSEIAAVAPTPSAVTDQTPVETNAKQLPSTNIDFVAAVSDELPVLDLGNPIEADAGISTVAPTPPIPAELISIDAALQAIDAGNGEVLLPYLSMLEKRLQPLLACRAPQR